MKFQIGDSGRIYDIDAIDKLRLVDLLLLQQETKKLGREVTPPELEAMKARLDKVPEAERKGDIDMLWIAAIGIFAARRLAGDDIGFEEAISFPIMELRWLPDPGDRKPAADPTQARRGSGRAANRGGQPSRKRNATSKPRSPAG